MVLRDYPSCYNADETDQSTSGSEKERVVSAPSSNMTHQRRQPTASSRMPPSSAALKLLSSRPKSVPEDEYFGRVIEQTFRAVQTQLANEKNTPDAVARLLSDFLDDLTRNSNRRVQRIVETSVATTVCQPFELLQSAALVESGGAKISVSTEFELALTLLCGWSAVGFPEVLLQSRRFRDIMPLIFALPSHCSEDSTSTTAVQRAFTEKMRRLQRSLMRNLALEERFLVDCATRSDEDPLSLAIDPIFRLAVEDAKHPNGLSISALRVVRMRDLDDDAMTENRDAVRQRVLQCCQLAEDRPLELLSSFVDCWCELGDAAASGSGSDEIDRFLSENSAYAEKAQLCAHLAIEHIIQSTLDKQLQDVVTTRAPELVRIVGRLVSSAGLQMKRITEATEEAAVGLSIVPPLTDEQADRRRELIRLAELALPLLGVFPVCRLVMTPERWTDLERTLEQSLLPAIVDWRRRLQTLRTTEERFPTRKETTLELTNAIEHADKALKMANHQGNGAASELPGPSGAESVVSDKGSDEKWRLVEIDAELERDGDFAIQGGALIRLTRMVRRRDPALTSARLRNYFETAKRLLWTPDTFVSMRAVALLAEITFWRTDSYLKELLALYADWTRPDAGDSDDEDEDRTMPPTTTKGRVGRREDARLVRGVLGEALARVLRELDALAPHYAPYALTAFLSVAANEATSDFEAASALASLADLLTALQGRSVPRMLEDVWALVAAGTRHNETAQKRRAAAYLLATICMSCKTDFLQTLGPRARDLHRLVSRLAGVSTEKDAVVRVHAARAQATITEAVMPTVEDEDQLLPDGVRKLRV